VREFNRGIILNSIILNLEFPGGMALIKSGENPPVSFPVS